MAEPVVWALGSVAVVSLISLIGALGLTFGALQRHGPMMFLVALAAGTLVGDSFLHILPEASHDGGFTTEIGFWVLAGFLLLFVLEIVIRSRHAHVEHVEHHDHGREVQPFGWLNLAGDALHNLLDGVFIATAYLVSVPVGVATTVAVALHEIPQELGDFAVLVRSGLKVSKALLLNLLTALFAVVGAVGVLLIDVSVESLQAVALPLVAGAFIYIAAADLVPELHHHSKGRDAFVILFGVLVGFLLMALLLGLEPGGAGHDHA